MAAENGLRARVNAARTCDAAIIGAGPAGSLAAVRLLREGRSVVILERDRFPRPAIGESLLPLCNDHLAEAGMLEAVQAAGFMLKGGATFLRGGQRERFAFENALPGDGPDAFQVPRDEFDLLLAEQAQRAGAEILFAHEVVGAEFGPGGGVLQVRDLEGDVQLEVRARFVLDCSGPGRVLPRLLQLVETPVATPRIACLCQVETDTRPTGEAQGDIWVCCHPEGGWGWIIPFTNGRSSVGFILDTERWDALPGDDSQRLVGRLASDPNTAARLGTVRPLRTPQVVRGYAAAISRMHGDGWAVVGHAGEFIDPVLSSGVALSLDAARRASTLVHRALDGAAVDWDTEYEQVMRRSATVFRHFVDAWYDGTLPAIFFNESKPERVKRRITSILAGYTLREDNPLAREPADTLATLGRYCRPAAAPNLTDD